MVFCLGNAHSCLIKLKLFESNSIQIHFRVHFTNQFPHAIVISCINITFKSSIRYYLHAIIKLLNACFSPLAKLYKSFMRIFLG